MQIRYQNVHKNNTYMCISFAFMTKVLESLHLNLSSYDLKMNRKIPKSDKNAKKENLNHFCGKH